MYKMLCIYKIDMYLTNNAFELLYNSFIYLEKSI